MHTLSTAEIFLPWNNTWLLLPPLPTVPDTHGHLHRITDAHIFSISGAGFNQLCLVGAMVYDTDYSLVYPTTDVWCLHFNTTSADYDWYQHGINKMGK